MAVVNWAYYRDGARVEASDYTAAVRSAARDGGFVWIGLFEPDQPELDAIAAEFGLHPIAVEDAVQAHERPKIERFPDTVFAVLKTVRYVPHDGITATSQIVATGEVMVFVGTHFVVTVRHGEHGGLTALRDKLESDPEMLAKGPSAVLYAVADLVVDTYLDVAERVEEDIAAIEDTVFADTRGRDAERIYRVKRELLELRRAVAPLGAPLRMLAEQPNDLIDPKVQTYFRDIGDHQARAHDLLAGYDEIISSMLQANLAQLSVAQNEDMRKITSWAAIIAVPTAIAGIYGMNFDHMPELHWLWGYPAALLVMGLACVWLYWNFKRRNWL
ncbi:MAG TPA: magnesium/cobalt transporter CorA [Jiangellaceae bacterium]